ncbi:MAG: adenylosuccinate synthetase, partial [Oscillospiraceae bacterium]
YGCAAQGATQVVLTALDCLSYLEEIKICTGYEINGEIIKEFPVAPKLSKAKPILVTLKGWHKDIRGIKEFDKLPIETQEYVKFIEKEIMVPITMVSNGPKRDEIIMR